MPILILKPRRNDQMQRCLSYTVDLPWLPSPWALQCREIRCFVKWKCCRSSRCKCSTCKSPSIQTYYLTKWFVKPLLSFRQFSLLEEIILASSSWVVHRLQASKFTPQHHLQGHCRLGITSTAELESLFHILFQPYYLILGGGDFASEWDILGTNHRLHFRGVNLPIHFLE